jgi:KaiC/GvpD/RAD55 family RecA-like ATPase
MPRKTNTTGTRKPMSAEAKQRIADAVRASAARKRLELGIVSHTDIPVRTRPLELVRMKDQQFDPILFQPMKTGKAVDKLFTEDGGFPRATNYMIVGDPGVGKSTVTLDMLSDLAKGGNKVLFISAEMTRIDLFGYVQRYPKFGNVDILFLGEYLDDNPKTVIEEALQFGYDVVLIDSFAEVQEAIKETNRMTTSGSEKFLIDMMIGHNLANNDSKTHTAFLVIQQVTKGGVFVGSNKLKHNTTGMLEIRFDDNGQAAYLMFTKNRRGSVNRKMYFSLKETGDVQYDDRRFHIDEGARDIFEQERAQIESDDDSFNKMFGIGNPVPEEDLDNKGLPGPIHLEE